MGQKQRVLSWLQEGKTLTRLQALTELGVFELASRLLELKRDGHKIKSESITVQNRWGEKCRVAQYSLEMNKCKHEFKNSNETVISGTNIGVWFVCEKCGERKLFAFDVPYQHIGAQYWMEV